MNKKFLIKHGSKIGLNRTDLTNAYVSIGLLEMRLNIFLKFTNFLFIYINAL